MDENIRNYDETIALLRKEIKAKDNDIHLAATFGKQLLDEREGICLKLERTQSRNEVLEQEKYSLQLDLETKVNTVSTLMSELEIQTKLVDTLQKQVNVLEKDAKVQKQRSSNLCKEKDDLEKSQEDLQLENSSLKNKIRLLEEQMENFHEVSILNINDITSEEEHPEINLYLAKNKTLQDALADIQYELESTKLKESRLVNQVKELEEEVSDRGKELRSYSVEIQKAKEFSAELQCEIETLKLGQVDVNRRGNSMFGELDDRRKLVEKDHKLLLNKYDNMLKIYEENKNELTRCKSHMAILLSMSSKKYQDTYMDKLESMLSVARRDKETLSLKLNKAMKSLQQQNMDQAPTKSDQYDYLRVMNQQAQKKIKELENELISVRLQILNIESNLTESHRDLYKAQKDINDLNTENLKLKQHIKDLNSKSDSDAPAESKPKIEALPGFKSNANAKKIIQIATNTNTKVSDGNNDFFPGVKMMREDGFQEVRSTIQSNNTILRSFNTIQDKEIIKSSGPAKTHMLNEIKEENEDPEQISLVSSVESSNKMAEHKKNVSCAQQ